MRVLVVNRAVIDRCPDKSLLPSHYWSDSAPAEPGQPAIVHCMHELKPGDQVLHGGEWSRVLAVVPGATDPVTGDAADIRIINPYGDVDDIGYVDVEDAR